MRQIYRKWLAVGVAALLLGAQGVPARAATNPKSALVTVPCGITGQQGHGEDDDDNHGNECAHLGGDDDGNHGVDRLEWYSGGVLVYTEKHVRTLGRNDEGGKVTFLVTGNGDSAQFNTFYVDPATSLLSAPDLTVKVFANSGGADDAKKPPRLVLFQPYSPVSSAVWSKHSEDTVQLAADIKAGDAATLAASKAYTDQQVASEAAARAAGDATQKSYTDSQIAAVRAEAATDEVQDQQEMANEAAARQAADSQLQSNINSEAAARQQGDQQTLASANSYTDAQVAAEAAARKQGDADSLAAAKSYTNQSVAQEASARQAADNTLQNNINNEASARQAADNQLQSNIDSEAAARQQGDQQTLSSANSYTDAQVSAEAVARKQGDADTLAASKAYTDQSVAQEASARQAADNTLQNNINNEASARQAADNQLQSNIDSEAAARQQGDQQTLASAKQYTDAQVASEAAARKQGDADTLAASKSYTDNAVANEASARQAADANLQASIDNEAAARQSADIQLQNNINMEASARQAADASLQASINNEAAQRQAADTTLQNNINGVQTALDAYKAKLKAIGTLNDPNNPVDFSELKNVPATALGYNAGLGININGQTISNTGVITIDGVHADAMGNYGIGGASGLSVTPGANGITVGIVPNGIQNNSLANSSISVNPGAGLAGGGSVSLGGTVSLGIPNGGVAPSMLQNGGSYPISVTGSASSFTGVLAGDVTGTQGATSVRALQGTAVSGAQPSAGQVLTFNGAQWAPAIVSNASGTVNTISKFTGPNSLGNSSISDNGSTVSTSEAFVASQITAPSHCYGADCRSSWNNMDANSVNPLPRSCPAGQSPISTGAYTWKCSITCANLTADCDNNANNGCETNIAAVANCGGCGIACPVPANSTASCSNLQCGFACNNGFSNCDNQAANGCEINITTDPNNCGACNAVCSLANAVAGCSNSACGVASCNAGFGNCDGIAANGCEVNVNNSVANCGGCGQACSANNGSPSCNGGGCAIACNGGFGDCNGNARADGCETNLNSDNANCGSCGHACGGNQICQNGACVGSSVRITSPGEGYGHHGACSGWNQCGSANTCALWACNLKGYATMVSNDGGRPCTQLSVCHLFYNGCCGGIQYNWGNWCGVYGVSAIDCR